MIEEGCVVLWLELKGGDAQNSDIHLFDINTVQGLGAESSVLGLNDIGSDVQSLGGTSPNVW